MGFASEGRYRVVLASADTEMAALLRGLGQFGVAQEAGDFGTNKAVVVQMRSESPEPRRGTVRSSQRVIGGGLSGVPSGWIAISGEVSGSEGLPAATRQARYLAALIEADLLPAGIHQFDRLPDIGIYRLLYDMWGSPALTGFVEDALGDLRRRDKRGTFRETLLAYLNAGGSHVETAAALGIHRNTLAYRLRQIGQLIGRDPDDPNMRLVMHLALVAASLPGALPTPGT
jgi:purine catabolism regulator